MNVVLSAKPEASWDARVVPPVPAGPAPGAQIRANRGTSRIPPRIHSPDALHSATGCAGGWGAGVSCAPAMLADRRGEDDPRRILETQASALLPGPFGSGPYAPSMPSFDRECNKIFRDLGATFNAEFRDPCIPGRHVRRLPQPPGRTARNIIHRRKAPTIHPLGGGNRGIFVFGRSHAPGFTNREVVS
jgi:hypothetical protein